MVSGPGDKQPALGVWQVRLSGVATRYDVWVGDASPGLGAQLSGHLDTDDHIEIPATVPQAISVGSFTSRVAWPRIDGTMTTRTREEISFLSEFSASGPSADGRLLPDLCAPGEFVLSSLSRDATPTSPGSVFRVSADASYLWADDGVHAALRGTSQAAPHVAGAVALLFQIDPGLTSTRVRELLRTTAGAFAGYPQAGFRQARCRQGRPRPARRTPGLRTPRPLRSASAGT